jgi:hypothetical protein
MTVWTSARERRAVVAHVAHGRFCRALLAHGCRRVDRTLLDAAETLVTEHIAVDEERAALALRPYQPRRL